MKKQTKKLLTLLLALTLVLGLAPMAAGATDDVFALSADDCVVIGEYMYGPAYLYEGTVPEGTLQVLFEDFAVEDISMITSMTGTNTALSDTTVAPFSDLFVYTAEDAEHDIDEENLELNANYADYAFENCYGFCIWDQSYEAKTFFVVYEFEQAPVEYDRTFSVSVGDYVVPAEDIELIEGGYTSDNPYVPGPLPADLYVVTVPAGTESVLLTFAENRLAYNYDSEGNYLYGFYPGDTYMTGALTAECPLDYGTESLPADGVIDYVLVQTPYDASWYSALIYAVTFVYAEELTILEQPEDFSGPMGSTATFSVEAEGAGLTYQWYVKNTTATVFTKSSVQTPEYSTKVTSKSAGRQLYCLVKDQYGNKKKTATVTLTAEESPVITSTLEDYSGALGSTASFSVVAEGEGLTYQWYVKKPTARKFSKSSITGDTYSVQLTAARDGNQVYCVITDALGNSVRTDTLTMTILK